MEQTRGNYYKMMGLLIAVLTISAVVAVWLPPAWKALVPVPQGRQGLYDFMMITLSLSVILGGLRAALAIEAHWLPCCQISDEQRQGIEKYTLPNRKLLDRLVMCLAAVCVVVVLFNY